MTSYKCEICQKIFERKSHYTQHINRKIKCKTIKNDLISIEHKELKEEHKKLREELAELKQMLSILIDNKTNTQNTIDTNVKTVNRDMIKDNNITNNTNNGDMIKDNGNVIKDNNITNNTINAEIKIVSFKNEDIDFITSNKEVLMKYLKKGFRAVPELVADIHFNKNKPENHNILLRREDSDNIYLYTNDGWICENKNDTIDKIIDHKTQILTDAAFKNNMSTDGFDRYTDLYENGDIKTMKNIQNDIKRKCLTGKNMVLKTKKAFETQKKQASKCLKNKN